MNDAEIVKKVIAGDHDAYAEIVERYQAPLLRYGTRLVRDEDAAADVVQQGFIKAYINLNGFNQKLKFSSWLYRIVHNEAVNYIKKHAREVHPDEEWFNNLPDEHETIETELDVAADRARVLEAIDRLDDKYRDVVVLHFLEHKKYDEISDILTMPTNTVGVRINRAKRKLREQLVAQESHGLRPERSRK